MTPEDRLAAFLSADAAPARPTVDSVFVAEVMQGVARRELGLKLASAAVTAVAAGAVLWVCAPVLDLAVQTLAPALLPAAGILTLAAAVSLLGGQVLMRR
jgi:predicted nucleic acid-binding protein